MARQQNILRWKCSSENHPIDQSSKGRIRKKTCKTRDQSEDEKSQAMKAPKCVPRQKTSRCKPLEKIHHEEADNKGDGLIEFLNGLSPEVRYSRNHNNTSCLIIYSLRRSSGNTLRRKCGQTLTRIHHLRSRKSAHYHEKGKMASKLLKYSTTKKNPQKWMNPSRNMKIRSRLP